MQKQSRTIFSRVVFLITFSLLVVCVTLINIYPYRPNSLVGWVLMFVFSLPVWFVFELIGTKILGASFVSDLSCSSRIIYGVITLGLLFLLLWVGFSYFKLYFGKWGY